MKVILVSIDDLRLDALSCFSDKSLLCRRGVKKYAATPTLDSLAKSGIFYTSCYSSAPYTTSSHASILTGAFQPIHGIREYYSSQLNDQVPTAFQLFKSFGYTTVCGTDFPALIGPTLGLSRGTDSYFVEDENSFLDAIARAPGDVFGFIHFGSVHSPYGLTSIAYDGSQFEKEVGAIAALAGIPEQHALEREWLERGRATEERLLRQRYHKSMDKLYSEKRFEDLLSRYLRGVEYFDKNRFSKFIARFQAICGSDWVMAVLADHGEDFGEDVCGHYNGMSKAVLNVPLLISGSMVPEMQTNGQLVRTVDVMPTLMDLAGLSSKCVPNDSNYGVSLIQKNMEEHMNSNHLAYAETWYGETEHLIDFMVECEKAGRVLPQDRRFSKHRVEFASDGSSGTTIHTDLMTGIETTISFDISTQIPISTHPANLTDFVHSKRSGHSAALKLNKTEVQSLKDSLQDLGYFRKI